MSAHNQPMTLMNASNLPGRDHRIEGVTASWSLGELNADVAKMTSFTLIECNFPDSDAGCVQVSEPAWREPDKVNLGHANLGHDTRLQDAGAYRYQQCQIRGGAYTGGFGLQDTARIIYSVNPPPNIACNIMRK